MLNKDQQHRLDVASFVVGECDKAKHPVTNLKLQRILYLLYGQFWSRYKKELFPAHFVAWKLGPVDLITQENFCTWTFDGLLSVKKQVRLYWCTDEEQDFVVEAVPKICGCLFRTYRKQRPGNWLGLKARVGQFRTNKSSATLVPQRSLQKLENHVRFVVKSTL